MTKQARDWHKDMELVKEYGNSDMPYNLTEFAKMHPYYLQQYAEISDEVRLLLGEATAEKERADELRDDASRWESKAEKLAQELAAEKEQTELWREHVRKSNIELEAAEAREKKLRETLERIMKMTNKSEAYTTEARVYHEAFKTLAFLYPKEEEAK